ncbi:hypothetical protein [Bradyrhizobium glycinis]|uniref:hypothetical protein n=1 Tax=Bradyrhizobium glycinis TaxID=2751812 RepID=UPI0018D5E1B1|nr:hypothetical protein [Bradyrhizobium glycinis]MBH5371097.1 hypothetical protein [Bradyrhizobium glycinis]
MNFQVTVLKILAAYPDGFAVMDDLKRDMAILATSGHEWADRTKRLAARVGDLNIWSQGLVERVSGGWKITAKGRAVLELMEAHPVALETVHVTAVEDTSTIPAEPVLLRQPADRANRRRERRERRRQARERARANAS